MHYLDPETQERVKAAAALAQQKERSMTTPGTHIENSGSDVLGVAPHVRLVYLGLILIPSTFPGTGGGNLNPANANVPSAASNANLLGNGVSSQREPSRLDYPVATHSATWHETHHNADRVAGAVSETVQPTDINRDRALNSAEHQSQDGNHENMDNPENTMTTDAAIAEEISTILSVHFPKTDRGKIASTISKTMDSLKGGDGHQTTIRRPPTSSAPHNQSTSDFLNGSSSDVTTNI
jgi:hypothetical protein